MQRLSQWILRTLGWQVKGWNPSLLNKYVMIVIPHTSNWDFPLGLLIRSALQFEVNFVGKNELFRWPFNRLLRSMGGYPIDRSKHNNYVEQVAQLFHDHEVFRLSIAPEGTRSKVDRIKTGFYYIAKAAKVPIVMVSFNFKDKEVVISEPIDASIPFPEIYEQMRYFYRNVVGKNPELGFQFET